MSWSYVLYDGRAYLDVDNAGVISCGEDLIATLEVAQDFDDWVLYCEQVDDNHKLVERIFVSSSAIHGGSYGNRIKVDQ